MLGACMTDAVAVSNMLCAYALLLPASMDSVCRTDPSETKAAYGGE